MGKRPLTQAYGWFLAGWAKHLSWKEVAEVFHGPMVYQNHAF
jgi:hypothetical protein